MAVFPIASGRLRLTSYSKFIAASWRNHRKVFSPDTTLCVARYI